MNTSQLENEIAKNRNILVVLQGEQTIDSETQDLINRFCGKVVKSFSEIQAEPLDKKVYVCGHIAGTLMPKNS